MCFYKVKVHFTLNCYKKRPFFSISYPKPQGGREKTKSNLVKYTGTEHYGISNLILMCSLLVVHYYVNIPCLRNPNSKILKHEVSSSKLIIYIEKKIRLICKGIEKLLKLHRPYKQIQNK